jgi:hypothetical protein
MQKSIRTVAMMFALTVAATPMIQAEPLGCNPRPQVFTSVRVTIAYTILAYFGL